MSEAKFLVNAAFQFRGIMRREGSTLVVSAEEVKKEIKKGQHPDTGKPVSGLLNHCSPADDFTSELVSGVSGMREIPQEMDDEEIERAISAIKFELATNGIAYKNDWKLKRFQMELKKAKILKGELWKNGE